MAQLVMQLLAIELAFIAAKKSFLINWKNGNMDVESHPSQANKELRPVGAEANYQGDPGEQVAPEGRTRSTERQAHW